MQSNAEICAIAHRSFSERLNCSEKQHSGRLGLEQHCSQLILTYSKSHQSDAESKIHCRFHLKARHARIGAIDVVEHYRRKGIGRQQVAAVEEISRHLEISQVRVLPIPSSIGFWEKLGFLPHESAARILNKWICNEPIAIHGYRLQDNVCFGESLFRR